MSKNSVHSVFGNLATNVGIGLAAVAITNVGFGALATAVQSPETHARYADATMALLMHGAAASPPLAPALKTGPVARFLANAACRGAALVAAPGLKISSALRQELAPASRPAASSFSRV